MTKMSKHPRIPGVATAVSLSVLFAAGTGCQLDDDVAGARRAGRSIHGVDCDQVVGSPSTQAMLEFHDLYRPTAAGGDEGSTIDVLLDGCSVMSESESAIRATGAYGVGFLPGVRTLSVVVDGVELATEHLLAAEGDVVVYALDSGTPPQLHLARATRRLLETGWLVHLMNMSGANIDVYRAVDPGASAPSYELVVGGVAPGAMIDATITASALHGGLIRIERAGDVIFEGNIGDFAPCTVDGGWPSGGVQAFWIVDERGPHSGSVYMRDDLECDPD